MTETLLRAEKTPVSMLDVYVAIKAACLAAGAPLARKSLLVLLSQIALETGNGASSYGYNLGGIKYTPGCGHDYYQVRTSEVVNGKPITIVAAFRSYPDLAHAATDYVDLVRGRFGAAWPAVLAGDVRAYAQALHTAHYFTAPVDQYAAGLASRYELLDALVPQDPVPPGEITSIQGQVAPVLPDDDGPGTPPPAED